MAVGIVSFGSYLPQGRIKVADIAAVWEKDANDITKSLGIEEKVVAEKDEDAVTLAVEAALNCLSNSSKVKIAEIEAVMVGSESHPYAVNPTSTIVAEALGFSHNYLAVDLEFACKAATAGMQAIAGLVEAKKISHGLIIGSDCAQARPHDVLEYTAGAGAAAFLIGRENLIAELIDFSSYSSDTPDFWRREGVRYPAHGGRFTGEPAYFNHVEKAASNLLTKTNTKPQDYDYCVFHSPNGKFPQSVAKRLGFSFEQLQPGFIVNQIGNPYSASSLLSLCQVLEKAKPQEKIFMVSYGSGAGSDAFVFQTTKNLKEKRPSKSLAYYLQTKKYYSYLTLLKNEGKI